jgi:hypothetical protein
LVYFTQEGKIGGFFFDQENTLGTSKYGFKNIGSSVEHGSVERGSVEHGS